MTKTVTFLEQEDKSYNDKTLENSTPGYLEYLQETTVDFSEFGPDYCEAKEDYEQQISRLDICIGILVALVFSGSVVLLSLAVANCLNMKGKVQKYRHDVDQLTAISEFSLPRGNKLSISTLSP